MPYRTKGVWEQGTTMGVRMLFRARVKVILAALAAWLAMGTAMQLQSIADAQAAVDVCTSGAGAGQCENPQGLAVDFATGHVYVAERGNNRVSVFDEDGSFLFAFGWGVRDGVSGELQKCTATTGCHKGIGGSNSGQFAGPRWIAVDNVEGSTFLHDVYVGTENLGVQRFDAEGNFDSSFEFNSEESAECELHGTDDPLAIGAGGELYVADSKSLGEPEPGAGATYDVRIIRIASLSGECTDVVDLSDLERRVQVMTLDAGGEIYVSTGEGIRKYGTAGSLLTTIDSGIEVSGLSEGVGGHLFASQREHRVNEGGVNKVIVVYSATDTPLRRFGYDTFVSNIPGLAPFYASSVSTVFASQPGQFGQPSGVKYLTEPPPGPVVVPSSVKAPAEEVRNVRARLWAEVNPEGKATTYRFDYLPKAAYEEQGGFEGLATKSFEGELEGEADFKLHGIKQTIGCLDPETEAAQCLSPETTYRWQAVAMNEDGEGNAPVDGGEFTTRPPIEILATYATEAGTDSAHLWAQVNPLGIAATGRLEYVSEATCDEDEAALGEGHCFDHATQVPAEGDTPLDFGGGEEPVIRGAEISGLLPATAYRYRVVVDNPLVEPVAGKAQTVRTFPTAQTRPCPENDAYRSGAGAYLPDCRAYEMVSPVEKNNGDVVVQGEATSNLPATIERSAVSGDKLTYGSATAFGDAISSSYTSQYIAGRASGAHPEAGWASHAINPPREGTLEVFSLDGEFKAFSPDLCETWLRSTAEPTLAPGAIPAYGNLYRRENCGPGADTYTPLTTIAPPNADTIGYELDLQGVSADGSAVLFAASDNLSGTKAPHLPGESAPGCWRPGRRGKRRPGLPSSGGGRRSPCWRKRTSRRGPARETWSSSRVRRASA